MRCRLWGLSTQRINGHVHATCYVDQIVSTPTMQGNDEELLALSVAGALSTTPPLLVALLAVVTGVLGKVT